MKAGSETAGTNEQHPLYHEPQTVQERAEYNPSEWGMTTVRILFDIKDQTRVEIQASMDFSLREDCDTLPLLILDKGQLAHVETVEIDGAELNPEDIYIGDEVIVIRPPAGKRAFCLSVRTTVDPSENNQAQGMFATGKLIVTQCESISFRQMVPFLDRPDVMPLWTVEIRAPKGDFPVLLSNPNLKNEHTNDDGTHTRSFQNPVPMPSYLFVMIAGDLYMAETDFITMSGRNIKLRVFTEDSDTRKVSFGLAMLGKALRWEEARWGIEYDLDEYGIVGVKTFNAGAMENKGMNVFSLDAIAGNEESREDDDLLAIAGTIAHELGHNTRGNRVGVRTWHEIPLKEGFTTFADQEFKRGLAGNIARLQAVKALRDLVFQKDNGSTSHPLSQDEYSGDPMEGGMYTAIPYQKGAEIIRMLETFMGKEKFRNGSDLYRERFDGQAITLEDLINTLAEAGEFDITQFMRWLKQVGVPRVEVQKSYDPETKVLELHVKQNYDEGAALQMPLAIGLIGPDGEEVKLELENNDGSHNLERGVLNFNRAAQTFRFTNVPEGTVPSLFRDFSAYADVSTDLSHEEYLHLAIHDTDYVNRWASGDRIAAKCILDMAGEIRNGRPNPTVSEVTLNFYGGIIDRAEEDLSLASEMLYPPSVIAIAQQMDVYDFESVAKARKLLMSAIAKRHEEKLKELYEKHKGSGVQDMLDGTEIDMNVRNERAIKNLALSYLAILGGEYIEIAKEQFDATDKMNDKMAALRILGDIPGIGDETLNRFYEEWKDDKTVTNKLLRVIGGLDRPDVLQKVREAMETGAFDFKGTKEIFTLFVAGFIRNHEYVHKLTDDEDGNPRCEGYELVGEMIQKVSNVYWANRMIDELFRTKPKLDETHQILMQMEIDRLLATSELHEGKRKKLANHAV